MTTTQKQLLRVRRHRRVRKRVTGTAERPRLAVFRSNKHISAQVIDDVSGRTVASASTVEADLRGPSTGNKDGFLYHGRVAALADAARENGLEF